MIDLKLMREEANISQTKLAKKCGVVRQTIGEIESGRNKPSVKLAKKLGEILNFNWWEFFDENRKES